VKAKSIPIPDFPKPKRKTGTCWVGTFAKVADEYPEPEDPIDVDTTIYRTKPTAEELKDELDDADGDWELISLLEVKL